MLFFILSIAFQYQFQSLSFFNTKVCNINQNQSKIVEGKLRSKEDYLTQRNADLDVWISENGSGIIPKIQYDPMHDELVGMTLDIDERNGCPQKFVSTAKDAEEIKKFMKLEKSRLVYIVLAIPLNEEIPPFILQLYGTNNKFNTTSVVRRWIHTVEELKEYILTRILHLIRYFVFF